MKTNYLWKRESAAACTAAFLLASFVCTGCTRSPGIIIKDLQQPLRPRGLVLVQSPGFVPGYSWDKPGTEPQREFTKYLREELRKDLGYRVLEDDTASTADYLVTSTILEYRARSSFASSVAPTLGPGKSRLVVRISLADAETDSVLFEGDFTKYRDIMPVVMFRQVAGDFVAALRSAVVKLPRGE